MFRIGSSVSDQDILPSSPVMYKREHKNEIYYLMIYAMNENTKYINVCKMVLYFITIHKMYSLVKIHMQITRDGLRPEILYYTFGDVSVLIVSLTKAIS